MKNFSTIFNTALAALLLSMTTIAFGQPTFNNKIPIPPLVDVPPNGVNLEMRVTRHKFNPANPADTVFNGGINQPNGLTAFAYNVGSSSAMSLLGPTLKIHTYSTAKINVKNLLGTPTTTHWHGMELPPMMDGGPHSPIAPGHSDSIRFEVLDSACTMWYHPHLHDRTLAQVSMGLSGMIIVEQPNDPIRNTMPHTYGVDDIPVIVSDLGTAYDPIYGVVNIDTSMAGRPYNIVNGVTNPYVEVPAHLVRLRILNGSTRKGIAFGLSDSYTDTVTANLKDFYMIATDGGYTLKPNTMKVLRNGPGARDEIVLDLSSYPVGTVLYLRNLNRLLPKGVVGSTQNNCPTIGNAFLELRIIPDPPGYTPITTFTPFTTVWSPGLADTSNIAKHRTKILAPPTDPTLSGFLINDKPFEMEFINDTICVGTKEIWTIYNVDSSKAAHPFHIHKIQFRILDIRDSVTHKNINLETYGLNGPKDDILVLPGWKVRFLGYFDDYETPIEPHNGYMYHCHILTHEDAFPNHNKPTGGMMGQFVVAKSPDCKGVVGVDTEGDRPSMMLYPNPSEGVLYLKGQSPSHSTVRIFDLHGRRLREQDFHSLFGEAEIDINGLSNGMYLVEWQTKMGTAIGKLVIQRP